ncbi:MAG: hypothetical protein WCP85_10190 [Mariniphaga sp.]
MKKIYLLLTVTLLIATDAITQAQNVGINSTGATPDASAMLDVSSTTKGFLAPRMLTSERTGISSPATGLIVYQTDGTPGYYYNSGTSISPVWIRISSNTGTVTSIDASGGTTGMTFSGGPITTSGSLTLGGTLAVANGGTGATSALTQGGVIYASTTTAMASTAIGTSGYLLKSNGSAAPAWLSTVPVANGGTGGTTAALARTSLGAAALGANTDITSLSGLTTDITVAQGGTGASTLTGYVKGSGTTAMTASATIPVADISGTLPVANGGTGGTTAALARTSLGVAASGANTDILSLSGLTTDITVAQGGTGVSTLTGYVKGSGATAMTASTTIPVADLSGTLPVANGGTGGTTAALARTSLGVAASGANTDILSLGGLTTDITVAQGGTGASTLTGYVKGTGTTAMTASATVPVADISGTLPVAKGGTGTATAPTQGGIVYASSASAYSSTAAGTTGQVLTSNGASAPTWSTTTYSVGDLAYGGIVFFVDDTGQHGLVCPISDTFSSYVWANAADVSTLASARGVNGGYINTLLIVSQYRSSNCAAKLCMQFYTVLNGINYGGWYLPDIDELYYMYANKAAIVAAGGTPFLSVNYWSSNENTSSTAYALNMGNGTQSSTLTKITTCPVRAIRQF